MGCTLVHVGIDLSGKCSIGAPVTIPAHSILPSLMLGFEDADQFHSKNVFLKANTDAVALGDMIPLKVLRHTWKIGFPFR